MRSQFSAGHRESFLIKNRCRYLRFSMVLSLQFGAKLGHVWHIRAKHSRMLFCRWHRSYAGRNEPALASFKVQTPPPRLATFIPRNLAIIPPTQLTLSAHCDHDFERESFPHRGPSHAVVEFPPLNGKV